MLSRRHWLWLVTLVVSLLAASCPKPTTTTKPQPRPRPAVRKAPPMTLPKAAMILGDLVQALEKAKGEVDLKKVLGKHFKKLPSGCRAKGLVKVLQVPKEQGGYDDEEEGKKTPPRLPAFVVLTTPEQHEMCRKMIEHAPACVVSVTTRGGTVRLTATEAGAAATAASYNGLEHSWEIVGRCVFLKLSDSGAPNCGEDSGPGKGNSYQKENLEVLSLRRGKLESQGTFVLKDIYSTDLGGKDHTGTLSWKAHPLAPSSQLVIYESEESNVQISQPSGRRAGTIDFDVQIYKVDKKCGLDRVGDPELAKIKKKEPDLIPVKRGSGTIGGGP